MPTSQTACWCQLARERRTATRLDILDNNNPPTLGTENATFTSVSSAAGTTYVAGDGLAETGGGTNTFSVNAGSGLEISSDNVRIAAAAAGAGLTGGAGSALAVGAGSGITVNADDVDWLPRLPATA